MKYCPLDPAPTSVVLQVLDVLLLLITCMINSVFESGNVCRGMDSAGPHISHVEEVWSRHRLRNVLQLKEATGCKIPSRSRKGCRKGLALAHFCSQ